MKTSDTSLAAALGTGQFARLTTFRRSGTPVATAIWFAQHDGKAVFLTGPKTGKARRIRRNPLVATCHAGAYANRWVIVVDDDIDPTDTNEVLWAMCTRCDVIEDVDVLKRCWSTPLDPMAYAGTGQAYFNNRMIIDACRPFDRLGTFPPVARASADEASVLRARFPDLFGSDGKPRRTQAS